MVVSEPSILQSGRESERGICLTNSLNMARKSRRITRSRHAASGARNKLFLDTRTGSLLLPIPKEPDVRI